ncbi:MAG TPA: tail fiber domain-containing protein [Verrucomicrobiae bacterium]|jgi:hypothetical protein|nr:tail fiber domain-containing protein [Verrucomicrobiae bacterium]
MKYTSKFALVVMLLIFIDSHLSQVFAQGTTFTYQGRLNISGSPAEGFYDFRFKLASDPLGNNYVSSNSFSTNVPVTNGLFNTTVNFGADVFTGSNYWLEVDVRTNNPANTLAYTPLDPLQEITPTPYSIFANAASNVLGPVAADQISGPVASANVSGTYANAVTFDNANNSFTGNGTGLTNVNAAQLDGLAASSFWQLSGNSGTTAGVNYVGTSDDQPMELHVNGERAMRVEFGGASTLAATTNITGAPNIIGGAPVNSVASGTVGSVIAGGGATNWNGQVFTSTIGPVADFSVISGGLINSINSNSYASVIGGGQGSTVDINSSFSTMSGGDFNTISSNSSYSTVGGGYSSRILASSGGSTIGGGSENAIETNSTESTIAGGDNNLIGPNTANAVVGGGLNNLISSNSASATISGGDENAIYVEDAFIGGGQQNSISNGADHASIAGGWFDTIGENDWEGVIAGGYVNAILDNSPYSAIGGGLYNTIQGDTNNYGTDVICGGYTDTILSNSWNNVIVGGGFNTVQSNSSYSAIGGGSGNLVSNNYSTIPGGLGNIASAAQSFAAGTTAVANQPGEFVWADANPYVFNPLSQAAPGGIENSFNVRSTGGFYVTTGIDGSGTITSQMALEDGGVVFASDLTTTAEEVYWFPGDASWSFTSDRNAKDRFEAVEPESVLDKVAQLPIKEWSYKGHPQRHIGAMAQDFHSLFPLNDRDTSLNDSDLHGVELAAIKGLNQKMEAKEAKFQEQESKIQDQAAEITDLKQELAQLKQMVGTLNQKMADPQK